MHAQAGASRPADITRLAPKVVGNNIANTNTSGFKASRAEFSDILAQSLSGAGSGSQIGRGVQLSAVSTQFTQGSFETTSSGTDLAIDGSGFFIVRNSDGVFYTRAGQFNVDRDGFYVVYPNAINKSWDFGEGKVSLAHEVRVTQTDAGPRSSQA